MALLAQGWPLAAAAHEVRVAPTTAYTGRRRRAAESCAATRTSRFSIDRPRALKLTSTPVLDACVKARLKEKQSPRQISRALLA